MSCEICNDFHGFPKLSDMSPSHGWMPNRHWKKTDLTWASFLSSAESCETCRVLVAGCRGCFDQHAIDEANDIVCCNIDFSYPTQREWTKMEEDTSYEGPRAKEIWFRLRDGRMFDLEILTMDMHVNGVDGQHPNIWEDVPPARKISQNTGSEVAFSTAQEWLTDCLGSSHWGCNSPQEPLLPTRVVRVDCSDPDRVYLLESAGKMDKYVCLSHCWGRKQTISTTTSTIRDYITNGILLSQLSNTFRQAVLFTRRLGISYIWIDSLCIIQDDRSDWEMESAKMAEIYSNGHLTIAATHSPDGDGGLYCETPGFELKGYTSETSTDYHLLFRRRIDHHIDSVGDFFIKDVKGHPTTAFHPLLTRAWVYQERMLSTRILHFGPYELFFECRTEVLCECGQIGFSDSSDTPLTLTKLVHTEAIFGIFDDKNIQAIETRGSPTATRLRYISRLWRTMVAAYTALHLTQLTDRLPAIGGLAREMAKQRRSKYLAGLWSDSLHVELTWVAHGASYYGKPRPRPSSAPTWSWASIDCPVLFGDEFMGWDPKTDLMFEEEHPPQPLCQVGNCDVTRSGLDEYGNVSHGVLEVTGQVVEGVLVRQPTQQGGQDCYAYHVTQGGKDYRIVEDYCFSSAGPDCVLPGTKVLCLRISLTHTGSVTRLKSLVLQARGESYDKTGEKYIRIGLLYMDLDSSDADPDGGLFHDDNERRIVIV